jgi:hypothetical protein
MAECVIAAEGEDVIRQVDRDLWLQAEFLAVIAVIGCGGMGDVLVGDVKPRGLIGRIGKGVALEVIGAEEAF